MRRHLLFLIAVLVAVPACSDDSTSSGSADAADVAAVEATLQAAREALADGDVAAFIGGVDRPRLAAGVLRSRRGVRGEQRVLPGCEAIRPRRILHPDRGGRYRDSGCTPVLPTGGRGARVHADP